MPASGNQSLPSHSRSKALKMSNRKKLAMLTKMDTVVMNIGSFLSVPIDVEKLLPLLSTVLGYSIIASSTIGKLPQCLFRYCGLAPTVLAGKIDPALFEVLYASQHAIFFFARVPQIWKNFTNKGTGELSFLTCFMNFAGSIVRVFTSIQEKTPFSGILDSDYIY
ncbi:hypothetical protein PR202_ga25293 [Eleusine coracana subsp. coracana]|uniref:Uncharacterized protein n=1 Tax=Eleusine coracana subsp. coracana TaxID=191504 RepID=A0AAV5DAP0_ELECO|nr:hypothetical protein PR202_ga25293 [Eleusine coracana subsp. coracana]